MMAANLAKAPLLRNVATRSFASPAGVNPIGGVCNYEVKNSHANGVLVASAENNSPLTRVSIIFKAGSRQETQENQGVAHVLRICAGLSTKSATQFSITRHIQQVGASLHCTLDRETISYTLEGIRSAVEEVIPFLAAVATEQEFRPWEIADNVGRIRLELATRPPQLRTVDLLHKAAFRTGLGNSLFIPKYNIGKIGTETLQHYVNSNLSSDKAAVVGLGVDHRDLEDLAKGLKIPTSGAQANPSPYKGGEIRSDKGGNLAYVAIAGEGSGLNNMKESVAGAVLQKIMGAGSHIPYGTDHGLLREVIKTPGEFAITGLSASYSDTGLLGAMLVAPSNIAGQLVETVVNSMRTGRVTDEWVNKGKNQLKASVLLASENGRSVIRKIGQTCVLTGTGISANQYISVIDSITTQDVNAALTKAKSKLSIAAFGNLSCVPHLADIK